MSEFLVTIEWNGEDRSFTEIFVVEADDWNHAEWIGEEFAENEAQENYEGEVSGVLPIDRGHENMVQNIVGHIGYLNFKPDQAWDCGGDSLDGVCDECVICLDEGTTNYIHEGEETEIMQKCTHCEELRE